MKLLVFGVGFAIAGIGLASIAGAQTTETLKSGYATGDSVTFHMESAWSGILTYDNSGHEVSQGGTWPITDGGVTCHVNVFVGAAETVTVTCGGPYEAHPRMQHVPDGELFDFVISYLGG